MANNDKSGTIYQKLNSFFSFDQSGFVTQPTTKEEPRIIIKGSTPEDIRKKGLELQQKKNLEDKFFRTTDHGFQKAMQYEAARLPAYLDYEGMEYYPLIASALNVLMEEATTIGENGKMLNIYSDKERIKEHLEELFFDIINVNVNLPFWTRNICKYGDNFVYILGEKNKGITHIKQLVNYEMERVERIHKGKPTIKFRNRETGDDFNIFEVAHFRLLGDDKYLPYGSSELNKIRRVFRQLVLAEDAMLTYRIIRAGEKRVFRIDVGNIDEDDIEEYIQKVATRFKKQQQVNPDSGQIDYRFNILGNDEDFFIPVRNANVQTGIDTLEGACLALDTKIELLDGRNLDLSNIIKEYEEGLDLWSYSINPETGKIVPGKITWAGITRKNTEVLKLTLDNGETITVTPDHKFPTKYNGIKEAKDLSIGESMWSFNKKYKQIRSSGNEYEMIYDHSINDWVYTHRMVDNYFNGEINKNTVRHHIDFNRYNNKPNNIQRLSGRDHFKLHADQSIIGSEAYKLKYENDEEFRIVVNSKLKRAREIYHNKLKSDYNFRENTIKKQSKSAKKYISSLSDSEKIIRSNQSIINSINSRNKAVETFNNNPNRNEIIISRGKSISKTKLLKENRIKQSNNIKLQWKDNNFRINVIEKQTIKYSHKLLDLLIEYTNECDRINIILEKKINIVDSEWLNEFNLLNQNNKQLNKMTSITRNNIDKMLKHFGYSNWKDFKSKIPQFNHKIINIEYLHEKQDTGTITIDGNEEFHNYHNFALTSGIFTKNSNLDQISDIEYLRDNLFTGLGIPKPFLGFQQAAGDGKNLAQMDIRFSKKINRIQQAVIQELNKLALIHLYLLGFEREDLSNFSLALTNPSTQQELLKTELWQQKTQVYSEVTRNEGGIAAMSHTEAKRLLFNWSDSDIIEDFKKQRMERAIAQELQDTPLIIRTTGIFKDIDKKYGNPEAAAMMTGQTGLEGGEEGLGGGLEGMGGNNPPPLPGGENEFGSPGALPPVIGQGQGFKDNNGNLIYELDGRLYKKPPKLSETKFIEILENLIKDKKNKKNKRDFENKSIIEENENRKKILNDSAKNMVFEIDDLLKETNTINKEKKIHEIDISIENIEIDDIKNTDIKEKKKK